jgi:hypothetical protein
VAILRDRVRALIGEARERLMREMEPGA